jgi:hypothetical protein|nr:MAG TPA: hemopoietic lineage transmembrane helix protein [Caudoviricetes sp.]
MDFTGIALAIVAAQGGFWSHIWQLISPTEAVVLALIGAGGTWYKIYTDTKMGQLRAEVDWARSDAEKDAAESAALARKSEAVDKASQELREWLTGRVTSLEAKMEAMQQERETRLHVAVTLFQLLDTYPDPPGAPRISQHVADHIGWEQRRSTVTGDEKGENK